MNDLMVDLMYGLVYKIVIKLLINVLKCICEFNVVYVENCYANTYVYLMSFELYMSCNSYVN